METNPSPLPPSIPAPPPLTQPAVFAPAAKPRLWNRSGFKTAVSIASIMLTLGTCITLYARASYFGQQVVEAHPVEARIHFANSPAYLDPQIVNSLLQEAYQYAQSDQSTYDRARNPQDASILREIASLYTGASTDAQGKSVENQSVGLNAWIKSITSVRREVASDKSLQTIQIYAQWRVPAAWVFAGGMFYLIDDQGIRLPGEYKAEGRRGNRFMVIAGMDLPSGCIPQPGQGWFAAQGRMAPDLVAGMALAQTLSGQPFASQINAIDVSNMDGRRDPGAPWMVLDTVYLTDQGTARTILWGRPIGEEKYYDVKAAVKLKNLNEIYQRFNRIDAGRDYVDIHTEMILLPKPLAVGQ